MNLLNFKKLNLSHQFLVVTMTITTFLLAGVLAYMVNSANNSKNDAYQIMVNGRTRATIEKIDRNFYERFGDVQAFAVNYYAIESATRKSADANIEHFINAMITNYVLYDLMMVCDADGKVVAVNTINREGKAVNTQFLIGKNVSNERWFTSCMSGNELRGGTWYSDFTYNNDVKAINGTTGNGLVFAAPIKDQNGRSIGVWYNFANWNEIVTGIRKETEDTLKKSVEGAFILVTDANGKVIESGDPDLNLKTNVTLSAFNKGLEFQFQGRKINSSSYIAGSALGKGAYTYPGNNWYAIAFTPKSNFTVAFFVENILPLFLIILSILCVIGIVLYRLANKVSTNIYNLKNAIGTLLTGDLVKIEDSELENEIGAMTKNLQTLVSRMSETSQFAKQIGEGNFEVPFKALSDKDELGNALIGMRDNLKKISNEEKKRSWATAGLAKFAEILRSESNITELCDTLLTNLVKYVDANQGAIFILQGDNEPYFELVSTYAYNRKKFQERRIEIGEGLVGQCYRERDTIFLTEVPDNYINITSGLGMANPTSILIVPLKVNEKMEGVLELASFKVFDQFEIAFIEKLAENICSTLSNAKINAHTENLLKDSQMLTAQLRAQEEEMRQNLEELMATQEELARKEKMNIEAQMK